MKAILISCFVFPLLAMAQWEVAPVFSDYMILQRNQPIRIWGKGAPGAVVSVQFSALEQTTTVQQDSSWMLVMPKQPAQAQPQNMVLTCGTERRVFRDILVGDVWICTGQSNMEWPMQREMHWNEEKLQTWQPLVRFLNPPPAGRYVYGVPYTDSLLRRLTPDKFYAWNSWQTCDSNTVRGMSAVAYYFAKRIALETGVPIGLINLSIGGAPLETFISVTAMQQHPLFRNKVHGNWLTNDALPVWIRERGKQNVGNQQAMAGDAMGPNHAYKPGFAFEAGVLPLRHFPVKGILIYQGESNAEEVERVLEYKELFKLLVEDYRKAWNNAALPVYWVQLSSIERPLWPQFRNVQREILGEVKHGGMAVTSDKGLRQDVHPPDKKAVGDRLSRWALHDIYGKNITPSGPLVVSATYRKGKVLLKFANAEKALLTSDGQPLRGFSLDGQTETLAMIKGEGVEIPSPLKPAFVYYAWKPFTDANLVNSSLLPASTFKLAVQ